MVIDYSYYPTIVFAVFLAIAIVTFGAWSVRKRRRRRDSLITIAAIIIAVAILLLAYLGGYPYYKVFVAVSFAVLACMLAIFYKNKPFAFLTIAVLLVYATIIYNQYIGLDVGMFGIGTVVGLVYRENFGHNRANKEDKSTRRTKIEVDRDIVQIVLGILVIAIILATGNYIYILFGLILIAYTFNSFAAKYEGVLHRKLSTLERKGTEYGRGAAHLAAGVAILIGFGSFRVALLGICALLFADAVATIIGLRFHKSRRLPYNRRKSYAGTMAFFITTAIFGAVLLGVYGILIAAALAIVESLELPLDDNVVIPIAAILLGLLI